MRVQREDAVRVYCKFGGKAFLLPKLTALTRTKTRQNLPY